MSVTVNGARRVNAQPGTVHVPPKPSMDGVPSKPEVARAKEALLDDITAVVANALQTTYERSPQAARALLEELQQTHGMLIAPLVVDRKALLAEIRTNGGNPGAAEYLADMIRFARDYPLKDGKWSGYGWPGDGVLTTMGELLHSIPEVERDTCADPVIAELLAALETAEKALGPDAGKARDDLKTAHGFLESSRYDPSNLRADLQRVESLLAPHKSLLDHAIAPASGGTRLRFAGGAIGELNKFFAQRLADAFTGYDDSGSALKANGFNWLRLHEARWAMTEARSLLQTDAINWAYIVDLAEGLPSD